MEIGDSFFNLSEELFLSRREDGTYFSFSSDYVVMGATHIIEFFNHSPDYYIEGVEHTDSVAFSFGYKDVYAWGVNKYGDESERAMVRLLAVIPVEE